MAYLRKWVGQLTCVKSCWLLVARKRDFNGMGDKLGTQDNHSCAQFSSFYFFYDDTGY